jgi:hypothetical protein
LTGESKKPLQFDYGEFPALLSAAEAYFGRWSKALATAGIDPDLYLVHHTWRKAKASDT